MSEANMMMQRKLALKKNIKKMIGLVSQADDIGMRDLIEIIPWMRLNGQLPSKNEMINTLREKLHEIEEDYVVAVHEVRHGEKGLQKLRAKTEERLRARGIDPHA